ncbi:glycerol kinase [Babesia caballi]|uniref:Glycerol kinase n=1 Tax=Babesia caballi TaxID=5871 RepID=A0AAV4LLF8_BABCB|nr:glycerol kinase [Babesia caballi]
MRVPSSRGPVHAGPSLDLADGEEQVQRHEHPLRTRLQRHRLEQLLEGVRRPLHERAGQLDASQVAHQRVLHKRPRPFLREPTHKVANHDRDLRRRRLRAAAVKGLYRRRVRHEEPLLAGLAPALHELAHVVHQRRHVVCVRVHGNQAGGEHLALSARLPPSRLHLGLDQHGERLLLVVVVVVEGVVPAEQVQNLLHVFVRVLQTQRRQQQERVPQPGDRLYDRDHRRLLGVLGVRPFDLQPHRALLLLGSAHQDLPVPRLLHLPVRRNQRLHDELHGLAVGLRDQLGALARVHEHLLAVRHVEQLAKDPNAVRERGVRHAGLRLRFNCRPRRPRQPDDQRRHESQYHRPVETPVMFFLALGNHGIHRHLENLGQRDAHPPCLLEGSRLPLCPVHRRDDIEQEAPAVRHRRVLQVHVAQLVHVQQVHVLLRPQHLLEARSELRRQGEGQHAHQAPRRRRDALVQYLPDGVLDRVAALLEEQPHVRPEVLVFCAQQQQVAHQRLRGAVVGAFGVGTRLQQFAQYLRHGPQVLRHRARDPAHVCRHLLAHLRRLERLEGVVPQHERRHAVQQLLGHVVETERHVYSVAVSRGAVHRRWLVVHRPEQLVHRLDGVPVLRYRLFRIRRLQRPQALVLELPLSQLLEPDLPPRAVEGGHLDQQVRVGVQRVDVAGVGDEVGHQPCLQRPEHCNSAKPGFLPAALTGLPLGRPAVAAVLRARLKGGPFLQLRQHPVEHPHDEVALAPVRLRGGRQRLWPPQRLQVAAQLLLGEFREPLGAYLLRGLQQLLARARRAPALGGLARCHVCSRPASLCDATSPVRDRPLSQCNASISDRQPWLLVHR